MKCHGRFKMQALTACDAKITSTRTAAGQFKVVQWGYGGIVTEGSKCKDSHAATAPKSRARAQQSVSSRGQWNVTCVGPIQRKTHVTLPRYTANSEHTIGAMEETSGKVQNASTNILRRQSYEHAHNTRSVQVPVQGGDG